MSDKMSIRLKIWRQASGASRGDFADYTVEDIAPEMSILEMLDLLNEQLARQGIEAVEFDGRQVLDDGVVDGLNLDCPELHAAQPPRCSCQQVQLVTFLGKGFDDSLTIDVFVDDHSDVGLSRLGQP